MDAKLPFYNVKLDSSKLLGKGHQSCRAARLLHTTRRMLEASGGRFQSHSEANYDVLLEHYLGQMLLLYRVSWLCNAR
jgi:hypothetical protein